MTVYRQSFNGGELTPELFYRPDLAKYQNSCRTIENFLVTPFGAVKRRPGTLQMHTIPQPYRVNGVPSGQARQFSFSYGDGDAVIVVIYNRYDPGTGNSAVRLMVLDYQYANRYDVAAPWPAASLNLILPRQINDVVWFTHPDVNPRKLSRLAATSWTLTEQAFKGGPFMDEEEHAVGITLSGSPTGGVYSGTIDMSAASAIFSSAWVGRRLKFLTPSGSYTESNWASGATVPSNTNNLQCGLGCKVKVTTGGTWAGELVLQSLDVGDTEWHDVAVITSPTAAPENFTIERDIEGVGVWVRVLLRARSAASGDNGCKVTLRTESPVYLTGTVTAVDNDNEGGDFLLDYGVTALPAAACKTWAEGQFGGTNGWPVCCAVYEERLVFAGTYRRPQSLWFSATNDWTNFAPGSLSTSAMSLTIAADKLHAIQWLSPQQKALMIGTDCGEWSLSSMSETEGIGPANVKVQRQTEFGSAPMDALSTADLLLFVQRGAQRMRTVSYDYASDGYTAPDISLTAKHILEDGIAAIAFQRTPDPVLWVVTAAGELATLSYDRENQVVGWARHPFSVDVTVLDVSVCRVVASGRDDVWLLAVVGNDLVTLVFTEAAGYERRDLSAWVTSWSAGAKLPFPGYGALVPRNSSTGADLTAGTHYSVLTGNLWYVHTAGAYFAVIGAGKDVDNFEWLGAVSAKYDWLDVGDNAGWGAIIHPTADCPADWNKVILADSGLNLVAVAAGSNWSNNPVYRCAWVYSWFEPVSWKLDGSAVAATARKTLGAAALGNWTLLFNADSKALTVQNGSGDVAEGVASWIQVRPYAGLINLGTTHYTLDCGCTALLRPLPFGALQDQQLGKVSRATGVRLYLLDAAGLEVSLDGGTTYEPVPTQAANEQIWAVLGQTPETTVPLVSGQVRVPLASGFREDIDVMIRNTTDLPATICAVGIDMQRSEK